MHLKPLLFTSFPTEVNGILKLAFTISTHIYILLFHIYMYSQKMHTFHKLYINNVILYIFSCILWNQSKYCILPNSLAIYFKQICCLLLIYSISRCILWCSSVHFSLFSLFLEISHYHGLNTT